MTSVILAIDGSEQAEQGAHFLSQLPLSSPLEVTLVTNVFVPSHDSETVDPLLKDFRDHQEAEAKGFMGKIEGILSEKTTSVTQKIVHGHVGHSIVEVAEETKSSLIVMGAKGHSQIARVLLGSTSDYVATHAPCSVLVVRDAPVSPLDIMVAYNDTPDSEHACNEIAELDWDEATKMQLLGIVPLLQTFSQDLMPNVVQYRTEQRVAAMHHLKQGRDKFPKLADNISLEIIESPHVGEAIVNECTKRQSDLIVVGDSERGSISRMLLGSVSRFVLRHAHCSVWVSRSAS
ncbi:Universal stress protein [Planctomycetes bacterium CA13]|uniref:Universal stress protein n=1 Tax=Novipirellula herctigrandis TaxID=2527986 RepID=A0A5C5Z1N5_9BACT|nr:Universal stress protein [Planctomycetes bacterium CA13]